MINCASCGAYEGKFVKVYKAWSYYDDEEGFDQDVLDELYYCIKCFRELDEEE